MTATYWWQPGRPEKALPGVLVEDDEHGWLLHLDGSFEEADLSGLTKGGQPVRLSHKRPNDFPVLVGTNSQGHLISLIDCQVLQWSYSILSSSRGALKIWPMILAHGVHFESAEDFRLMSLSVRYTHVDTWAGANGFTVKFGTAFYPVEVRYAKPDPVECALPDGLKVSIDFSAFGPAMPITTELRITQRSWLTVTSRTDLSFKKLLEHVTGLADLISLGVGEPLKPLEMSATCNAQDPSGGTRLVSVEIIHNRKPLAPVSRDVSYSEMLFTLPDVRDRFGELIAAWFGRDDAFRSLYTLYFGTIRSPFMYVEHRFLNMFQALESFDRRTSQLQAEKMQEQAFRRGRRPPAADRIKHVVETLNASWLLTPNDIELSANLRIYYTHFDPKIEAKLPPPEERPLTMHNLEVRLRVLCELVLLKAVGFPMDKVRELIEQKGRLESQLSRAAEPE